MEVFLITHKDVISFVTLFLSLCIVTAVFSIFQIEISNTSVYASTGNPTPVPTLTEYQKWELCYDICDATKGVHAGGCVVAGALFAIINPFGGFVKMAVCELTVPQAHLECLIMCDNAYTS